jgi:hypothetical protein
MDACLACSGFSTIRKVPVMDPQLQELGPFHVPIVPMSVKAPVAESMLYMETSFEPEFVT